MILKRLWQSITLAYEMIKVILQLIYGAWRISALKKPIVTIFGGARAKQVDFYFLKAHELGERLLENDISVLTGGGPGIMEGVSCGAYRSESVTAKSIGIGVKDLNEKPNICVQEYFVLDHFFARKWLLTYYSSAFVVFPGGFGTLDELSGVLTLMQTKKLPRAPIVLIGKEYWDYFMRWIEQEAVIHGTLADSDVELFTVTDDLEEAFCLIRERCVVVKKEGDNETHPHS